MIESPPLTARPREDRLHPNRLPQLPHKLRKAVLVAHITSSLGWLGADAVLLVLVVTGFTTEDPELARASYVAIGVFVPTILLPAALAALVTGLVLSAGTRWGLVRHYWVLVKLGITAALTGATIFALRPRVRHVATEMAASDSPRRTLDLLGDVASGLLFPPIVSMTALLVAVVLSIYKPWGMTRWARRASAPVAARQRDRTERRSAAR